ncbi:hypothetical protein [Lapillicoccus jejuensis]|uniref:DUF308 domain-containing protein n=1 Tax=Lapillicoccus jejuensis TaxID=402171 RepID=A0A542E5L8_9MICO|nr:hypothetical protein [Lapillicoccus jejuensis]TQJ10638.1 hypothetical protein FB458_3767 [Lapillicoccus jejuensis]
MPDKDVDEQFAAIMAHWHEDALGLDPYGDPDRDERPERPERPEGRDGRDVRDGDEGHDDRAPGSATAHLDELDALSARDLDDLRDLDAPSPDAAAPAAPAAPVVPSAPVVNPVNPAPAVTPPPVRPAEPDGDESRAGSTSGPRPGTAWRAHVPVEDPADEHYVPPPPQPLPSSEDKHFWLMMLGLVGGPLLFLWLILFDRDGNGWWMVGAIGMTVAGFVLLVLRQPFERDEDDDGVRL